MKIARFGVSCFLAAIVLSGCKSTAISSYDKGDFGPGREVVISSIDSIGGLEAWRDIAEVNAMALVTVYDDTGQARINRHRLSIDVNGRKIKTTAATPTGIWRAEYSETKGLSVKNEEAIDGVSAAQLSQAMALMLHRASGPLNLLDTHEQVTGVSDVCLEGRDLKCLTVNSSQAGPIAYYFDADDSRLRMLGCASQTTDQSETITLYEYQNISETMVFPKSIRVFRTGRHTLVSERPILTVEFSEVTLTKKLLLRMSERIAWRKSP